MHLQKYRSGSVSPKPSVGGYERACFAFKVELARTKDLFEAPHLSLSPLGFEYTNRTLLNGRDGLAVSLDCPHLNVLQHHQR